jgi:Tol biopolymer transport system component
MNQQLTRVRGDDPQRQPFKILLLSTKITRRKLFLKAAAILILSMLLTQHVDAQSPAVATPAAQGSGHIAYLTTRNGNADIYWMDTNGDNPERISTSDADDISPAWSHDGKTLAFASMREDKFKLYTVVMPHGGESDPKPIDAAFVGFPSWSPDDKSIAVAVAYGETQEICIFTLESNVLKCLTSNEFMDTAPSWSPDGKQILFETNRDGNYELYVMNTDGTHPVNLTNNPASDLSPTWSPDSKRIAFSSDRDGNLEIYTMKANGSDVRRLTDDKAIDDLPSWSPDGKQIAFSSERTGYFEIFVMDADGKNIQQLTNDKGTDSMPAWQPASTEKS